MTRTRSKKHDKKHKKTSKKKKRQLVVGMISVPLTPGKKYYQVCGDSYIASSHIKWLKRFGIKILPIPKIKDDKRQFIYLVEKVACKCQLRVNKHLIEPVLSIQPVQDQIVPKQPNQRMLSIEGL